MLSAYILLVVAQCCIRFSINYRFQLMKSRESVFYATSKRGFSSDTKTKPIEVTNTEAMIQKKINNVEGLRELMKLYDDLQDFDLIHRDSLKDLPKSFESQRRDITTNIANLEVQYGLHKNDIRNRLHEITWDSTAATRQQRHETKQHEISKEIQMHMEKMALYTLRMEDQIDTQCISRSILDVGCGTGVVFQYMKNTLLKNNMNESFIQDSKWYGIDLSNEMLKYCRISHPYASLIHGNYQDYFDKSNMKFSCITFNECLHNFHNTLDVLKLSKSLLYDTHGRIVISHPRGYDNVMTQYYMNKWLVPCYLPSKQQLIDMATDLDMKLLVTPIVDKNTPYLAVLETLD